MGARIRGIAFPFDKGPEGIPKAAEDGEAIKADFFLLMTTTTRTRVMRPILGADLLSAVFDSTGAALRAKLQRLIVDAASRFESRIRITGIKISETKTTVTVDVDYKCLGVEDSLSMKIDKTTGEIKRT